jgi:hypothetical protein
LLHLYEIFKTNNHCHIAAMDDLLTLIEERNVRETYPFVSIHASYDDLWNEVDNWQRKCEELERSLVAQEEELNSLMYDRQHPNESHDQDPEGPSGGDGKARTTTTMPPSSRSESAALRNERKMREQLERLESQIADQQSRHEDDLRRFEAVTRERDELHAAKVSQDRTLVTLQDENDRQRRAVDHLTNQVEDSQQRARLAEQQYAGLKDAIRVLQEENDLLKRENRDLESRFVSEKERLSSEMNTLTDLVDRLKRRADMAQTLQKQEEKRKSWFGYGTSSASSQADSERTVQPTGTVTHGSTTAGPPPSRSTSTPGRSPKESSSLDPNGQDDNPERRYAVAAVVPTQPKFTISAHYKEASCVR